MKIDFSKNKSGFTLIELLVVISIIGLLSTVVLQQLNSARKKAEDSKIYTEVDQLKTAFELYKNDNNFYLGENVDSSYFYCTEYSGPTADCPGKSLSDYFKSNLVDKKYISAVPDFKGSKLYYFSGSNLSNLLYEAWGSTLCGDVEFKKYSFVFIPVDYEHTLNISKLPGTMQFYCFGV